MKTVNTGYSIQHKKEDFKKFEDGEKIHVIMIKF